MHQGPCPRPLHHFQALSEARPLAMHGDPEGGELLRSIPRPEAEHQSPAGHQVEGRRIFGDTQGMSESENGEDPDANTVCGTGEHASDDEGGGTLPIDGKMVLSYPQRIE